MKPENKIFSAILGLNPQIVTESIFAIINDDPDNAPDSVYVLSTSKGIERCIEKLINEQWLKKVYQHFFLPSPKFTEEHCITFCQQDGTPLEDIRTYQDSEDSADTIFNHIAKWCDEPSSQLHLSVGGGRKTLDLHAGLAMNICSKPIDTMSQVLVSDPRIENHPDFFFPNQPHKQRLITREKEEVDVRNVSVDLIEIDYIRLRKTLEPTGAFCSGKSRLEIIAMGRRAIENQTLDIDQPQCSIIASGTRIKLPPIDFAFYSWIINEKLKGTPVASTPYQAKAETIELAITQIEAFLSYIDDVIVDYRNFSKDSEDRLKELLNTLKDKTKNHQVKLQEGVHAWGKYKTRRCSDANTSIKKALKEASLIDLYTLQSFDAQGNVTHGSTVKTGIRLDIKITPEDIDVIY